jgi:hypothetical protein
MGQSTTRKSKNRRLVISRHWLASVALGRSWDGGIEQRNFDGYAPMGMSQIPEIEISIIGNGEPAVTVIAIGNALFNAVGPRVRSLPITADAVKAAMKAYSIAPIGRIGAGTHQVPPFFTCRRDAAASTGRARGIFLRHRG